MGVSTFNIRVYGLLLHEGRVLVSDELVANQWIAKFPGGGMVPGEGTLDCLRREIKEEMNLEAKQFRHFYTTDFFQASAYNEADQIVSIYYTFKVDDPGCIMDGGPAMGVGASPGQRFRWLAINGATEAELQLPIDRVVMRMIRAAAT